MVVTPGTFDSFSRYKQTELCYGILAVAGLLCLFNSGVVLLLPYIWRSVDGHLLEHRPVLSASGTCTAEPIA